MLFLPKSVYDARSSLWKEVEAGRTSREQAFHRMLEIDPDDHVAMLGLGRAQREAGNLAGAEELFWRALRIQPCAAMPYLELSRVLAEQPESAPLAGALQELGVEKRLLGDDDVLGQLDLSSLGFEGEALETFRQLSGAERNQLVGIAMRTRRELDEPQPVAALMRPWRLLQQIQEDDDLDAAAVDAIVAEGESMVPLLVGLLRAWAQNIPEYIGDAAVENALGLLGETGSAAEIPYLLEFVDLQHEDAAGAAKWALGRVVARDPQGSRLLLASISASLGLAERLTIAEQILRCPELDPAGELLGRMSENLETMTREDRGLFLPPLFGAMAAARGMVGVKLARRTLLRQQNLLSRSARRECEELLAAFELEGVSPARLEPSTVTVYQICSGNAIWETEDETGELDDDLPPQPVRRKVTPERNDPCWCGSGKKYKKCHLDADQLAEREPPPAGSNEEFAGLRKSIGEFLGEALPTREMKRALTELFGEDTAEEDRKDLEIGITDWVLHDWPAPSLRRTVMQEFLARRGYRLTEREREMVQAWAASFIGLYEVQETEPGKGLTLKDLLLGGTFFVHDVSMSRRLVRWDGILTRVVPGERGLELAGVGLAVPRQHLEPLREWMERDRGEAGSDWHRYLKANWPRIRRQSLAIARESLQNLRLTNTDGEELLLSKAVCKVADPVALIAALRACPELDENESGERFVWLNDRQTVLGNLCLAGDQLTLDVNSRERLERGKQLLVRIAGNEISHVRDEVTTQQELKRSAMQGPKTPPPEDQIPADVKNELIARYLAEHYGKWPDQNLPALDGKTPREAMKTAQGRRQVIEVLKSIENGEERKRLAGEPAWDVSQLRAELGLD